MEESVFELYFDDLTPEAQERLLLTYGLESAEEANWNIFPIAVI